MIFLPILRSTLSSNSAKSRGAPTPRTPGILHFPMEFLALWYPGPPESFIFPWNFSDFPPHTEAQLKLIFCEAAWWLSPPGPPESIIFLRNFNDFPSLTEAQLKVIFCEIAWRLCPQDL